MLELEGILVFLSILNIESFCIFIKQKDVIGIKTEKQKPKYYSK